MIRLKAGIRFITTLSNMEGITYYTMDNNIIIDDPKRGILKRDRIKGKRVAGPGLSDLRENAKKISEKEAINKFGISEDLLALLENNKEKTLESSRITLYPEMAEIRFIDKIKNKPNLDVEEILKALEIAKEVHKNHKRKEGTPYIGHCIAVATKALEKDGDTVDVIISLLHDSYEDHEKDREMFLKNIEETFGENIAQGIKKLSKYRGTKKIDNLQYLEELSKEIKTLKIKGFDRINNLECLRFTDKETRIQYIKETEEKYIPLFEKTHIDLANEIKKIINLYNNNNLELEKWEEEILEKYKT